MLSATDPLDHWRTLPIKQQPSWYAPEAAAEVSAELATLPPLVFAGEVDILREKLGRAAAGEAFLLQGGHGQSQRLAGHAEGLCQGAVRRQPQPARPLLNDGLAQRLLYSYLLAEPFRLQCIKLYALVQHPLAIHEIASFSLPGRSRSAS